MREFRYNGELVLTSDGQQWIYDDKHQEWINVTMPEKLKGKITSL